MTKALEDRIDVAEGAQLAMFKALSFLLAQYKGNPVVLSAFQSQAETLHAQLLASQASDRKIESALHMWESLTTLLE